MRMSNLINNICYRYKLEKWNEKKEIWEFITGSLSYRNIKIDFENIKINGVYRIIKTLDIKQIGDINE